MRIDRRQFMGGLSSLFLLGSPLFNARAAKLAKKNLVIINLRGGLDGLAAVPYIGDQTLEKARPTINVNSQIKLSSDFALHPELKTFHSLWEENKATIIHATSIPYTGRSHFEGQDIMQTGGLKAYNHNTGWLGRGMDAAGLGGLAVSLPMPLLLRGEGSPDNFFPTDIRLPGRDKMAELRKSYSGQPLLEATMDRIISRPISMMNSYHGTDIADLAATAAEQLASANGPRVAVFDINGFDTHAGQGNEDGELAYLLYELSNVVKELRQSLGGEFDNTLIMTLTEFGRMIEQNSGNGTEHGYGTAILAAGGLLKKSQIYTDWPGIKKKDLFEGRDLNVTIDARSVYCSAMAMCFDADFELLRREAFFGADLQDMTGILFSST